MLNSGDSVNMILILNNLSTIISDSYFYNIVTIFSRVISHSPNRSGQPESVHCISSNGLYLFLQTSQGLFKIGTGYAGTIKGHIYKQNSHFHPRPGIFFQ